ncbi:MAG: cryptochrome/photolyase family protein [Thioalkalivibrionaceae bacterium]
MASGKASNDQSTNSGNRGQSQGTDPRDGTARRAHRRATDKNQTECPKRLWIILGDQLDPGLAEHFDWATDRDEIWMAEVAAESRQPLSHRARALAFLAAMRHRRDQWREAGFTVHYRELGQHDASTLAAALVEDLPRIAVAARGCFRIQRLISGDRRVEREVREALEHIIEDATQDDSKGACQLEHDAGRDVHDEPHFLYTREEFADWARGRRELRLEWFYREARRHHNVLMDGDQPVGERWNFDASNRGNFGKKGPTNLPRPLQFEPDAVTLAARADLEHCIPELIGSWDDFDWPVTPEDAKTALDDFIATRLADFGRYQDAMWTNEPWLYHARLSCALNLKLLDPREVIARAEAAYRQGQAPLEAVEGFIRQVLGWREYVRGLYHLNRDFWHDTNALDADEPLPELFWSGQTDCRCLAESVGQTLRFGYAHHIQRLMVLGLFAQLVGVRPREISDWFLAVYVDAVEWVEIPNVIGMSQYADGGRMASKPYVATGKYIQRMSNYCTDCRYNPSESSGADACPFTTLYWDFLARHAERFARHPRTALQWKNLARIEPSRLDTIRRHARDIRHRLRAGERV